MSKNTRHPPPPLAVGDYTVAPHTVDPFTELRVTAIHGATADLAVNTDPTRTYLNVPLAELVRLGAPIT